MARRTGSAPTAPAAIATLGFRNRFAVRNTGRDCFTVRRLWLELELADGRRCSSEVSAAVFSQPPGWAHAEGVRVPFGVDVAVELWFRP